MFNLATLFVSFEAKTKPFDDALRKAESDSKASAAKIGAATSLGLAGKAPSIPTGDVAKLPGLFRSATTAINVTTVSMTRLVSSMGALAIFGAAFAGFSFLVKGVKDAADLREAISATENTFEHYSGLVLGQADKMARTYGVQKKAQLEAANAYGEMAMGAGATEKEAATLSNTLVKLSADLMSNKNIPFEEALVKIRAALAGEAEPLRQYGANISEANIQQGALRLGLAKSTKDISDYAKTMARASLIQTSLAKSSGDLERTADSVSNQFRKSGGGIENFGIAIGEILMPAVEAATLGFNEMLGGVVEAFEANKSTFDGWVGGITEAFNTVRIIVGNFGTVWEIAVVSVTGHLANILAVADTLPENFSRIATYIATNWYQLLVDGFEASKAYLVNYFTNVGNLGKAAWGALKGEGFTFEWTPLLEGFEATAAALPELVKPALVDVQGEVDKLAMRLADEVQKKADEAKKAVEGPKAKGKAAAKKPEKEEKSEEFGFADFSRKLASRQTEGTDQAIKDNTVELKNNRTSLIEAKEAFKKGFLPVFN